MSLSLVRSTKQLALLGRGSALAAIVFTHLESISHHSSARCLGNIPQTSITGRDDNNCLTQLPAADQ
ncbi:MAG: hypothetical protein ACTXOO_03615 [Sodalis sp. (in: enterobacteria)]